MVYLKTRFDLFQFLLLDMLGERRDGVLGISIYTFFKTVNGIQTSNYSAIFNLQKGNGSYYLWLFKRQEIDTPENSTLLLINKLGFGRSARQSVCKQNRASVAVEGSL